MPISTEPKVFDIEPATLLENLKQRLELPSDWQREDIGVATERATDSRFSIYRLGDYVVRIVTDDNTNKILQIMAWIDTSSPFISVGEVVDAQEAWPEIAELPTGNRVDLVRLVRLTTQIALEVSPEPTINDLTLLRQFIVSIAPDNNDIDMIESPPEKTINGITYVIGRLDDVAFEVGIEISKN